MVNLLAKKLRTVIMLLKISALAFFLMIPQAYSETIKQNLVVKVKNKNIFEQEFRSENYKNLFSNLYVLRDSSLNSEVLRKNKNIEYVEIEQKSQKRELAKDESLLINSSESREKSSTEHNDPLLRYVWSYGDAANNGMSVYEARREFGFNPEATITVAVIDTGVEYNHDDLKNVMWINTKEISGNGIDDDGNGYIDDIYGINTINRLKDGTASGDIRDIHSHGTHVAGTIGAESNNLIGIAGIASNVKIMAIRAVPHNGDESDIDVAESLIYAANNGARVVNCSFGKKRNEGGKLIPEALEHLNKMGVVVVVAAGNDRTNNDRILQYPASFEVDNLISVASTTNKGELSSFSNYGEKSVHIAAPGSSIYSTTPRNKYTSMSGTSMASPAVAGLVAEVLSFHPDMTPLEVKNLLMSSSIKSDDLKGKTVSGGRANLLRALEAARNL